MASLKQFDPAPGTRDPLTGEYEVRERATRSGD